jgi:hypothetical protein
MYTRLPQWNVAVPQELFDRLIKYTEMNTLAVRAKVIRFAVAQFLDNVMPEEFPKLDE